MAKVCFVCRCLAPLWPRVTAERPTPSPAAPLIVHLNPALCFVQVTKEATTHLAFHPNTDTLIVACAGAMIDSVYQVLSFCCHSPAAIYATPAAALLLCAAPDQHSCLFCLPHALHPAADKKGNMPLWHVNEGSYSCRPATS